MKDMKWYIWATYSDICQPYTIIKTPSTFPNPEMPTTIPETGAKRPNTYGKMTYLKKNNIDEDIHQKLRKKDVYETDMHNIYNNMVGQTNKHDRNGSWYYQPIGTADPSWFQVKLFGVRRYLQMEEIHGIFAGEKLQPRAGLYHVTII